MKFAFFAAALSSALAVPFVIAACSSSSVDNTEYGPPDAGKPDAAYCVLDHDCQLDGGSQSCGFPVSDSCEARGVCVDLTPGACGASTPMCGCNGDTVTTCGGYAKGGPTNGATPTEVDGSAHCNPGR